MSGAQIVFGAVLSAVLASCTSAPPRASISYALHVASTPEKVWDMLTDEAQSSACWAGEWRFESTWAPGASVRYSMRDGTLYSEGRVLSAEPGRSLSYTWPEPAGGNPPSTSPEVLTWEITPSGPQVVKVTVVHEGLPESARARCTMGWEFILSNMKTLLELGRPLEFHAKP